MKYILVVDQVKSLELGLTIQEAHLISLMGELSSWADAYKIGGEIFYKLTTGKIVDEMPLVIETKTSATKYLKRLKDKKLIDYAYFGNESYYKLSELGKMYSRGVKYSAQLGRNYSVGEEEITDNKNTINTNITISKDIAIETQPKVTKKRSPNISKDVNLLIDCFRTLTTGSGYAYGNEKERQWASTLLKNKDLISIFDNPIYGVVSIMKFANKDEFWSGKITSLKSFYYNWTKVYNQMKKLGLIKSLEETRKEEEAKRKARELFDNSF